MHWCFRSQDDDKENEETKQDPERKTSPRHSPGGSPRRMVPREGQPLTKVIQAHAHEAEDILHHSTDDESAADSRPKLLTPPANFSATNLADSKLFHSMNEILDGNTTNNLFSTEEMIQPNHRVPHERRKRGSHTRITKAVSTPLLIGQILEERESDLDDSPAASPRIQRNPKHQTHRGGLIRSKHQSRRLSPVPSTGSRRSSSCSSSDEDELEKRMRRLNTNNTTCKKSARRGSHEDSSSEGDGGLGGGSGGTTKGGSRGSGGGGDLGTTSGSKGPNGKSNTTKQQKGSYKQNSNARNNSLNKNGFILTNEKLAPSIIDTDDKENCHGNSQNCGCSSSDDSSRKSSSTVYTDKENHSGSVLNYGYSSSEESGKKAPVASMETRGTRNDASQTSVNSNQLENTSLGVNNVCKETLPVGKSEDKELQGACAAKSERKSSASKYIHSRYSVEDRTFLNKEGHAMLNGLKRDSLRTSDLENIEMSVSLKRTRTNESRDTGDLRVIRTPAIQTVTSNCCQIF